MGLLVDGQWHDQWYDTSETGGRFVRTESQFRNWITADGSAGETGEAGFAAQSGRYHLYVSYACPWAHRALIFRALKGLQSHISVSAVDPLMLENGWEFGQDELRDPLFGSDYLYQIYTRNQPDYSGRVTVPVLWDKQREMIVNNESSEIIRMLNTAFNDITGNHDDYYPVGLQDEINQINELVYDKV